jgi:hypothetical protein
MNPRHQTVRAKRLEQLVATLVPNNLGIAQLGLHGKAGNGQE